MDFEDWLRGQLSTPPESERRIIPATGRSRLGLSPFITGSRLIVLGIAIGAVAFGASSQIGAADPQLGALSSAPALPANTWAGSPPTPIADARAASDRPTPHTESSSAVTGTSQGSTSNPTARGGDRSGAPQAAPAPPAAQTPAAAPPASRSFDLIGGSATITCKSGTPSVASATPRSGFSVERETHGSSVEVRFRSDQHDSKLEAWCSSSGVQGQIEEGS